MPLFLLVIAFQSLSFADSKQVEAVNTVEEYLAFLPKSTSDGLTKYLEIVGVDIYKENSFGGANYGINAYLKTALVNPCINAKLRSFYQEMREISKDSPQTTRPQVGTHIGKGPNKNLQPGWVWSLAMKHSNNNPRDAMMLIATCGHDDFQENFFPYCPDNQNIFYAPAGLSEAANISDDLATKIWKIQGDANPSRNLPAKAYHVYAGTFAACEMLNKGMSPALVKRAVAGAAMMYRGIRLCDKIKVIEFNPQPIKLFFTKSQPLTQWTNELIAEELLSKKYENPIAKEQLPYEAMVLINKANANDDKAKNKEKIIKYLDDSIVDYDAAQLYNRWYLGGRDNFSNLPCTGIRNAGPYTLTPNVWQRSVDFHKPVNWPQEKYDKALKKLATWDLDFEFTQRQHFAGAEFAVKYCKPDHSIRYFEKSCAPSTLPAPLDETTFPDLPEAPTETVETIQ